MKKLEDAKKVYEKIEIPEELSGLVEKTIEEHKGVRTMKKTSYWKYSLGSVAGIALCFTVALNTSYSFAQTAENVPVIGTIAKVLTIRSYEEKDDDKTTTVNVPAIEEKKEVSSEKIKDINAEIDKKVNEYIENANKDIAEYKEAFLETGGTEEEWKEKDIQVKVDYEIKAQTDDHVSFVLIEDENWCSAYGVTHFYNIDLNTGEPITLEKLLGKDYIKKANESILSQMKEREEKDDSVSFFTKEEGGFETITDDTKFYINEKGNPVIVFDKYEVATGATGQPEFEIEK